MNSTWLHWPQIVKYPGEMGAYLLFSIDHPLERKYELMSSYLKVLYQGLEKKREYLAVFENKPLTRCHDEYLWR